MALISAISLRPAFKCCLTLVLRLHGIYAALYSPSLPLKGREGWKEGGIYTSLMQHISLN